MEAAELNGLKGKIPEDALTATQRGTEGQVPKGHPSRGRGGIKAALGGKKYQTRVPTGGFNPGKTNATVNSVFKGSKWAGRVFLVIMAYDEYRKVAAAKDWTRQLGSSSSGVLGAIGGGTTGGAVVGGLLGAAEFNPLTIAVGTFLGGMIGGAVGYSVCSGDYEALYDVLYSD